MMKKTVLAALLVLAACTSKPSALNKNKNSNFIVGGETVSSDDSVAKTTVGVYDILQGAVCTGTLLTKNIVVTAGHCAQSPVRFMRIVLGLNLDESTQVLKATNTLVNPKYAETMTALEAIIQKITDQTVPGPDRDAKLSAAVDAYKNWGDVALVQFAGDLPAGYAPATLLDDATQVADGTTAELAGYGLTKPTSQQQTDKPEASILHKVNVKVADAHFSDSEVTFDQSEGKGACHGDSGGPAFVTVNGQSFLFGVTSRGINDPNDTCGTLSAYTFLPAYKDWIQTTIKGWTAP